MEGLEGSESLERSYTGPCHLALSFLLHLPMAQADVLLALQRSKLQSSRESCLPPSSTLSVRGRGTFSFTHGTFPLQHLTLPRGEGACRKQWYVGVQGPMQRPRKAGFSYNSSLPLPSLPLVWLSATPPTSRPASPEGEWQLGCPILTTGVLCGVNLKKETNSGSAEVRGTMCVVGH